MLEFDPGAGGCGGSAVTTTASSATAGASLTTGAGVSIGTGIATIRFCAEACGGLGGFGRGGSGFGVSGAVCSVIKDKRTSCPCVATCILNRWYSLCTVQRIAAVSSAAVDCVIRSGATARKRFTSAS